MRNEGRPANRALKSAWQRRFPTRLSKSPTNPEGDCDQPQKRPGTPVIFQVEKTDEPRRGLRLQAPPILHPENLGQKARQTPKGIATWEMGKWKRSALPSRKARQTPKGIATPLGSFCPCLFSKKSKSPTNPEGDCDSRGFHPRQMMMISSSQKARQTPKGIATLTSQCSCISTAQ